MNAERIADRRVWLKGQISTIELGHRCFLLPETDDIDILYDLLLLLDEKAEQIEANVGVPDEQDLPAALEKMASPGLSDADERALGLLGNIVERYGASTTDRGWIAGRKSIAHLRSRLTAPPLLAKGDALPLPSPGLSDADERALDTLVAYAREGAERIYEGKASARDVEAALLHIRSRLTAPPLLANGDAQPKPTVTRTQIKNIAWGILSYLNLSRKAELVSAITDSELVPGLRDLGITVEEEKNG